MSKLIPLEEAAGILGLTEDKVAELRSSNEIFGYRDGATWKFKMSELERVADELGITLNVSGSAMDSVKGKIDDAVSELGLALEDSDDDLLLDEPDSVELLEDSSVELFADSSDDLVSSSASSLKLDDLKLLDDDDDDSLKLGESSAILKDDDSDKPADSIAGAATTAAAGVAAAAAAATAAAASAATPETKKADDSINLSSSSIFDSEDAISFGSDLSLSEDTGKADESSDLLLAGEPSSDASGSGTGKDVLDIADSGGDALLLQDDESAEFSLEDSVSLEDSLSLDALSLIHI